MFSRVVVTGTFCFFLMIILHTREFSQNRIVEVCTSTDMESHPVVATTPQNSKGTKFHLCVYVCNGYDPGQDTPLCALFVLMPGQGTCKAWCLRTRTRLQHFSNVVVVWS